MDPSSFSKSTNAHMHLLEAFTVLYQLTQDPRVKDRLTELVSIVLTHLIEEQQGRTYMANFHKADWSRAVGASVPSNVGHDIEMVWLVYKACDEALGWNVPGWSRRTILNRLVRLGLSAARSGIDEVHGGFYELAEGGLPTVTATKDWWPHFEGMEGLFRIADILRREGDLIDLPGQAGIIQGLFEKLDRTVSFIHDHQYDHQHGGFFQRVRADGSAEASRSDNQVDFWKCEYHSMRGLMNLIAWLSTPCQR